MAYYKFETEEEVETFLKRKDNILNGVLSYRFSLKLHERAARKRVLDDHNDCLREEEDMMPYFSFGDSDEELEVT